MYFYLVVFHPVLQHIIHSDQNRLLTHVVLLSVGPSHSGGLSPAAVCALRHNGPFRWKGHERIHQLMRSIVTIARLKFYRNPLVTAGREEGKRGKQLVSEEQKVGAVYLGVCLQ